jgi:hypothetical protein
MKKDSLLQILGAGAIAAVLAVAPLSLPGHAQTNTAPNQSETGKFAQNNQPNLDTTPLQETEGQNDNFGWLGLLGALGLLNLLRKPKTTEDHRQAEGQRNY